MARNEEKAQSMLNHFITMKEEEKRPPKQHRPYLASECCDLAEADKLGQQIMHEISRKVAEIQNEGLGEHCIRGLNDEIDKLIQEKVRWERRIVELRGHNYSRYSAKMTDLDGNIVDVPNPSGRGPGYRYFGAAKKLPGVRELFEKPPELRKRPTRRRPTGWAPPFQTSSHRVGETRAPPLPELPLYRKSPYTDLDSSYEQPRQYVSAVGHAAMFAAIKKYMPNLIPSPYLDERLDLVKQLKRIKKMKVRLIGIEDVKH
ncbi:hypothetical protein SASPL_123196 [Salvia splendens]|uniref:Pre-mRNA-splicing factor ISY1 n=1 Tax=Salvia splendens TaxID=180675 RepID=A0A8X8XL90_SALSN|nr:hypothetical protein SASPL_123196 [Salvia splendens]